MSGKIKLQNVRLSFPSLFQKAQFPGDETQYAATFMLDKVKHADKIAEIDAAILAEIDRGFEVTYAAADPTPDKLYTDVYIHYDGRLQ